MFLSFRQLNKMFNVLPIPKEQILLRMCALKGIKLHKNHYGSGESYWVYPAHEMEKVYIESIAIENNTLALTKLWN